MAQSEPALDWRKVAEPDELAEGRVKSASAAGGPLAITHFDGQYAAMDNRCPHQGGPLGEGSIEKGVDGKCWLRCPWHGWDFDPLTGKPPGGHEDSGQQTYPIEMRADGLYVGLSPQPARQRTISDVMVETMINWQVSTVFGMVGHSNLGLADALRVQVEAGKLRYYGIRHEGAAAFAASAYGKLIGKPAAALTIAGPGATNLMTGLWDAKVDSAPVLAMTGQVQEQVIGVHAFQDIDLEAAFEAVACFSQTVHPNSVHAALVAQPIKTARVTGGVGHLVFPDNTQTLPASEHAQAQTPQGRLADRANPPPAASLAAALDMVAEANRPMIIVGYGARTGMAEIIALAEKLGPPIATTFKAKGQIADAHPLAAGVLGRSGTPIAAWFMTEAALLIAFGASFSDHTGIYPDAKIIHIDLDQMRIGKRHGVSVPVLGDVAVSAALLAAEVKRPGSDQRAEIAERWRLWRAEKAARIGEDRGKGISAAALFDALSRFAPEDAILPVDVGNNTYSFGRYFEPSGKQRVLMSGYLGSIGFAFPAAMGAWAATEDEAEYRGRKIISISGDGGFGQYAMEFTTAVKYGMNICHLLLNNGQLGKISKEQRAASFPVWQTELINPAFAGFARSCGGMGKLVRTRDALDGALLSAIAHKGPALVAVLSAPDLV